MDILHDRIGNEPGLSRGSGRNRGRVADSNIAITAALATRTTMPPPEACLRLQSLMGPEVIDHGLQTLFETDRWCPSQLGRR